MNEQTLIKIMQTKIMNGLDKFQLREHNLFKNLDREQFDKVFHYAKKPINNQRDKERREKIKRYGRLVGFKISEELYQKLWRVFNQQVAIPTTKRNEGRLIRDFLEEALRNKYKKIGLDWNEEI